MDLEEARRVLYTRVQCLDSTNVLKIMGYLLLQDIGDQEMLQLAVSSDSVLHAFVSKAKQDLGLLSSEGGGLQLSNGSSYSCGAAAAETPQEQSGPLNSMHERQGYGAVEMGQEGKTAVPCSNPAYLSPLYELISMQQERMNHVGGGGGSNTADLTELLCGSGNCSNGIHGLCSNSYLDRLSRSSSSGSLCYDVNASANSSSVAWKPCVYFARGYCKHGSGCRFLHVPGRAGSYSSLSDDSQDSQGDPLLNSESLEHLEMELHELLTGRRSPVSIASLPQLYYERFGKTLQADGYLTESQRHGKAGYSLTKLLARLKNTVTLIDRYASSCSINPPRLDELLRMCKDDGLNRPHGQHAVVLAEDAHKFMAYRGDGEDLSLMSVNPSSRQIYLTFPAESSFSEEDVNTHFSAYGPVQDVRIPYQQKRMFGFVTFTYSETVRQILAEGNPHYICGARVLVKPYKEKGKHGEKKLSERMEQQAKQLRCQSLDRNRQQNAALRYYLQDQALTRTITDEDLTAALQQKLAELHFANVQKRITENKFNIPPHAAAAAAPITYLDHQNQVSDKAYDSEDANSTVQDLHHLQPNPYGYVLDMLDADSVEETKHSNHEASQPGKEQQVLPCNLQSDQKKFLTMPCDTSPPTFFAHDIF